MGVWFERVFGRCGGRVGFGSGVAAGVVVGVWFCSVEWGWTAGIGSVRLERLPREQTGWSGRGERPFLENSTVCLIVSAKTLHRVLVGAPHGVLVGVWWGLFGTNLKTQVFDFVALIKQVPFAGCLPSYGCWLAFGLVDEKHLRRV